MKQIVLNIIFLILYKMYLVHRLNKYIFFFFLLCMFFFYSSYKTVIKTPMDFSVFEFL